MLVNPAENVSTCRRVSICRYFGDIINTADDHVMVNICDKMCDLPNGTRQRKTNLSEEDYAATAISKSAWNPGYEDAESDKQKAQPQAQRTSISEGAKANTPDPGQKTLWDCLNSVPVQGFKRPNAHGRDKLVLPPNAKKAKVEHIKDDKTSVGTNSSGSTSKSISAAYSSMPPPLVTTPQFGQHAQETVQDAVQDAIQTAE
ncbi:hypothetical protein JVU11DRAFT_10866 [Chiua virens]|nr:hypothetical protein JVU11DRAFT_10866 [Chiua virens]